MLGHHEAGDPRVEVGPRVRLLRLGHLDRADPARRAVGVVAEPDRTAAELDLVTREQLVAARDAVLRHEARLAERVVELALADRNLHEPRWRQERGNRELATAPEQHVGLGPD